MGGTRWKGVGRVGKDGEVSEGMKRVRYGWGGVVRGEMEWKVMSGERE